MSDKKITIVTDSSSTIPEEALKGLDVKVIPLWLNWDGVGFLDGIDIDPKAFYQRLRRSKTLPSSSQPSVQEFIDFFQRIANKCDTIVNVLVSSKISGTIDNARKAMENLPNLDIHLIDTLAGSMGAGHIVLAAARAAKEKASVDAVIKAAEHIKERINLLFLVDTLEYLHKGGRIGGAKRYLGTALRIKPLLEFKDGLIQPLEQVRTRKKAISRMLDVAAERLAGKHMEEATVVDIDCPDEGDAFAEIVKKRFSPRQLFRSGVSPVVGTHVGPGALGLAFYAED